MKSQNSYIWGEHFPMKWWWGPLCTRPTCLIGSFIVLDHWHNSPQINMSPYSDTLSCYSESTNLWSFSLMLSLIFIVLAHWNNSPQINMSPYSDTLFWFWVNQSLIFLLNAACFVKKQHIPILCKKFFLLKKLKNVDGRYFSKT